MPTLAQAVLPFDCTLCGVLVATTDPVKGAKPHLRRRLCGPCKGRVNYAERTGRTVSDLRRHAPKGSRPARKWGKSTVGQVFDCRKCGAQFVKRGDNQKYCSIKCADVDGYERRTTATTEPCEWCGKDATGRRYKSSRRRFCGRKCQMAYKVCVTDGMPTKPWPRTRPCIRCGEEYPTRSNKPARCPDCLSVHLDSLKVEQSCQVCGETVLAMPGLKRCDPCKKAYQREKERARRKRKDYRPYKHKRRQYVIARDGGRCQVCRCRVVLDRPNHPRAAEVDHIIPVSLWPEGQPGVNKPTNLRLLCRTCNLAKSNGTAPGGDQLLLVG